MGYPPFVLKHIDQNGFGKLMLRHPSNKFSCGKTFSGWTLTTFFLLTFRAETEEIQAVVQDLETGFFAHFLIKIAKTDQLRIDDFFTAGTDHMGMGKRLGPVIAVASVGKTQF
jgi:hypothetical protein